jgi:nucleoside-diphosphate-sugar epimerase/2-polyprenyl-3-methyl-5-hydroxy-6-metoxy-1,4-benzoquinol methylase
MNILITGGTGFIGSRLALKCIAEGHRVTVYAKINNPNESSNRAEIVLAGGTVIVGSVTDFDRLKKAVEKCDLVFHLAAIQHEMNIPDQVFREVNVGGTRNLMEACLASSVSKIVHASTIGVYGNGQGTFDETSPCHPDNIYGETKLEGERLALSYGDRLPVTVVRIPETYGPGDRRLLKLIKLIQKYHPIIIGDGRNQHHPIYVDDLVQGLLVAGTHPNSNGEIHLLAGPEIIDTRTMVDTIAKYLNPGKPTISLPILPFVWMASLLEHLFRPLGIQPPLHQRRIDFFRTSYQFSFHRTTSRLSFAPTTTFDQGIFQTIQWYQEKGWIGDASSAQSSSHGTLMDLNVDPQLTAQIEPFDTFWEAPENIEKGFNKFQKFYRRNYFRHLPPDKTSRILVISCGTGYFVESLRQAGYNNVLGIDSDGFKVEYAVGRGLNCVHVNAFPFLIDNATHQPFDIIIAEQEINHLTKPEIIRFLELCHANLSIGGRLFVHALNGANPITGAEALAQNFDHYNTFTEYSLKQVLCRSGYTKISIFPLNLYIFYENPINYVGMLVNGTLNFLFRIFFIFYGKENTIFSKKIGACAVKAHQTQSR